jgi:hypothetical protein
MHVYMYVCVCMCAPAYNKYIYIYIPTLIHHIHSHTREYQACIYKWLEHKSSCPYCRTALSTHSLVNARFMEDVYSELERLKASKKKVSL